MKKLLMVLCVVAFGIGAAAQAQVVNDKGIIRTEPKAIKENVADIVGMPVLTDGTFGQLKDESEVLRDTLHWHPEYDAGQPDCATGIYSTYYGDNPFAEEVIPGVFSPYMNGTGEVGATYQTQNNVYKMYAGIDVSDAWVVGALAIACRMGNTTGWYRIQNVLGQYVDIEDDEHMNEIDGVLIPDMPFTLYGYSKVQFQTVFRSYTEMIFDNKTPDYIDIEMPTATKGRTATNTLYLRYEPTENDEGELRPGYYAVGGMFDKAFRANQNFGISLGANLAGDKTIDSLWNYNFGAKSNDECAFIESWAVWQRFDFRNHDLAWVGFWSTDESDIDVSRPWFDEENSGFAPPGSIQTEPNSLFVYNHSLLRLSQNSHYKPTLYPIIQHGEPPVDTVVLSNIPVKPSDAYSRTVSVYPLPATDNVTVVALDAIRKVEIYNMAGTLVKVIEMNDNVLNLDVTSFTPGAYVARITTAKGVASKKLLVK